MPKKRRVIADAGPLMTLAKLNALPLLKRLYGTVLISQTVYNEVVTEGLARGYPDAGVVQRFWQQQRWKPRVVNSEEIPLDLQQAGLDLGERESLFLAARERTALLLVDEEAARSAARERGVRVKGALGVLVEAFQKKHLDFEELELLFAQIEQRDDIWISAELCRLVLAEIKKESGGRQKRKKSLREV
jgi:predicted nucleic acid-binding protein